MWLPFFGMYRAMIPYKSPQSDGFAAAWLSRFLNVLFCGKAEVGREPGNGKLPLETFRLVGPNIIKHLTAGIRSKPEVQKNPLNFQNVL